MNHRLAIATISLGWHESHALESKLAAVKQSGIPGIELCNYDLERFAEAHGLNRLDAASKIGQLCKEAELTIVAYPSFADFEGHKTPLKDRLKKAEEWCNVARRLGTDMIQVPSNTNLDSSGDEAVIVTELQELAAIGARYNPPIRFAYEALAWGTHAADMEESWRIVNLVKRPNFGLCLDTYHVLARLWADPSTRSGMRPGGRSALRDSLERFRASCPIDKIFYIQLSDGERANPPILPGHEDYSDSKHVLFSWCLHGRIFPLETELGAYLPMRDILVAWLVESGWDGWVSMEVFHYSMKQELAGPRIWSDRALVSWQRIQELLGAEGSSEVSTSRKAI